MAQSSSSRNRLPDSFSDRKQNVPQPLLPNDAFISGQTVPLDEHGRVLLSPPSHVQLDDPTSSGSDVDRRSQYLARDDSSVQSNFAAYALNAVGSPTRQNGSVSEAALEQLQGLHIRTDLPKRSGSSHSVHSERSLRQSMSTSNLPRRATSIRAALHTSAGSISPGSAISSPQIAAMLDVTPLPSPTLAGTDLWGQRVRTRSRESSNASKSDLPSFLSSSLTWSPKAGSLSPTSPSRRKVYPSLRPTANLKSHVDGGKDVQEEKDPRTRSVSDYVPEALSIPKPRTIAVSTAAPLKELTPSQTNLHREEHLAETRGITSPAKTEATSIIISEDDDDLQPPPAKRARTEVYHAKTIAGNQHRRYASVRSLGQGAFSRVFLAVEQTDTEDEAMKHVQGSNELKAIRNKSRRLVAVKIVEHGPAGGADTERIEVSLRREIDIMKHVNHPSLVRLKAFGTSDSAQALLIMNYCPGGDLFELASLKQDLLQPPLLQRIFAELVSAVCYLHSHYIVHRDIKLENVLVNLPVSILAEINNFSNLDRPVVTLTDLGLSRRIPKPPESPLLTTRCGSEDYAAPELLMGQPYDGRQTDAWALGVLLYALLEGRLPFDPLPGARGDPAMLRARTPHRIARIEWAWYRYGDEDGEWDGKKGMSLHGARQAVEALLQRQKVREALDRIEQIDWVKTGLQNPDWLSWHDED